MAKLENLSVEFISLVASPANRRGVVLKSVEAGGREAECRLLKADRTMHRLYGVVYAPDEEDAQGDWADAETIRKAADEFMLAGRSFNVDMEHDFKYAPAYVAESWLVKSGDPVFPDETEGAWAVGIQVTDTDLWGKIEEGEVAGLSLAGTASIKRGLPGLFKIFGNNKSSGGRLPAPTREDEMKPEEVKELIKAVMAEERKLAEEESRRAEGLEKAVAAAVAKAMETVDDKIAEVVEKAVDGLDLKGEIEELKKVLPKGAGEGGRSGGDDNESFV